MAAQALGMRLEMTEQDFAAYQFGGRSEICAAYRSSIPAEG